MVISLLSLVNSQLILISIRQDLEVIKLEFILRLKIKHNKANHCALF